ncbi:hypothetical protein HYY69_06805 [Candidatus Woesearchaeota archaeon]|nr:hypothetical protein [Candidatus Woesearchaeota archaeon]
MICMPQEKIILTNHEPSLNPDAEQLAQIIIARIGLLPRKNNATDKIHKVLLELYERQKTALREKDPSKAIITVEEMAMYAGITRQTMYDYLKRWLLLDFITKTSFVSAEKKMVIGYKMNGSTLENAFEKSKKRILDNLDATQRYIVELQKSIKNEKISQTVQEKNQEKEMPIM